MEIEATRREGNAVRYTNKMRISNWDELSITIAICWKSQKLLSFAGKGIFVLKVLWEVYP